MSTAGVLSGLLCRLLGHRWHTWTGAQWTDQHGLFQDEAARARATGVTGPLPATVCDRCGVRWEAR